MEKHLCITTEAWGRAVEGLVTSEGSEQLGTPGKTGCCKLGS